MNVGSVYYIKALLNKHLFYYYLLQLNGSREFEKRNFTFFVVVCIYKFVNFN